MSKPTSRAASSSQSQRALQGAVQAMRMQRPDEAERITREVLRTDRNNILALQILGHALLMMNRAADAIVPLETAAARSNEPSIETLYAGALAGVGRRDDALAQLQRTIARRPLYPPAVLELSAQLAKANRLDEATGALEAGLAIAPDALDLRMELGFHHLKRNDRTTAQTMFAAVLTTAPGRMDAHIALAKVMALDGNYAAAVETYQRVLAHQPGDVMTRNNLAICLLELNRREAGEASLRDAVRAVPQIAGHAITALAAASHGRFFLRPSAAAEFLRGAKP